VEVVTGEQEVPRASAAGAGSIVAAPELQNVGCVVAKQVTWIDNMDQQGHGEWKIKREFTIQMSSKIGTSAKRKAQICGDLLQDMKGILDSSTIVNRGVSPLQHYQKAKALLRSSRHILQRCVNGFVHCLYTHCQMDVSVFVDKNPTFMMIPNESAGDTATGSSDNGDGEGAFSRKRKRPFPGYFFLKCSCPE
jgi:hypothetical protein